MYKDILTGRLPLLGDLPEEFWNVPDTNETVAV